MTTHELKTWPEYFGPIANGYKTFEVRRDDRGFEVGDHLRLREWNDGWYTTREMTVEVTYILRDVDVEAWQSIAPDYCVMAIKPAAPLGGQPMSAQTSIERMMDVAKDTNREHPVWVMLAGLDAIEALVLAADCIAEIRRQAGVQGFTAPPNIRALAARIEAASTDDAT